MFNESLKDNTHYIELARQATQRAFEQQTDEWNGTAAMMKRRWLILLTEPRREHIAAASLIAHRVDVYLPEYPRRPFARKSTRERLEPMFPGYLLAHLPAGKEPWKRIRITPGICCSHPALRVGDHLATLPDVAIQIIRAKEAKLCKWVTERPGAYRVGQEIEIVDGPFAWFAAKIEELASLGTKGRITASVSMFGRVCSVDLDAAQIRAV